MGKQFPHEFQEYLASSQIRAAFISEIVSPGPTDCKNCAGVGSFVLFLAKVGPLRNPPSGAGIIAHWDNGHWWGGASVEEVCPVCHGSGIDPTIQDTKNSKERDYRSRYRRIHYQDQQIGIDE